MFDEIRVYVIEDPGRRYFQMRYVDPITGKPVKRSTKKARRQ